MIFFLLASVVLLVPVSTFAEPVIDSRAVQVQSARTEPSLLRIAIRVPSMRHDIPSGDAHSALENQHIKRSRADIPSTSILRAISRIACKV